MTVDIEEFDQGEHIDLHITESSYTDETRPAISSLGSLDKASPKAGLSQASLHSQKSAEKHGSQTGISENEKPVSETEVTKEGDQTEAEATVDEKPPSETEVVKQESVNEDIEQEKVACETQPAEQSDVQPKENNESAEQ